MLIIASIFYANSRKRDHAATALAMLHMFGLGDLVQNLQGAGVHSLSNIITMAPDLHQDFDRLGFWLEAVPNEVWNDAPTLPLLCLIYSSSATYI